MGVVAETEGVEVTRIRPSRGWVGLKLGEVWAYRELLYFLVWRDVKVRYKNTAPASRTFFANGLTNAANSLVGSANLLKKVYFPRLVIPMAAVADAVKELLAFYRD